MRPQATWARRTVDWTSASSSSFRSSRSLREFQNKKGKIGTLEGNEAYQRLTG